MAVDPQAFTDALSALQTAIANQSTADDAVKTAKTARDVADAAVAEAQRALSQLWQELRQEAPKGSPWRKEDGFEA